jgi:hypothetical protein
MPVDALPAAFSVPSQVETVGALAGLAAILGLAVLSMLYFAQARELKRLREWAGRAPERAAELQQQAMTAVPRRVTPQPVPNRAAQRPATPVPTPRPPGAPAAPGAAGATAAAGAGAAAATPGASGAPAPATPGTGRPATAAATAAAASGAAAPKAPANGQTGTPGAPASPDTPDAGAAEAKSAAEPTTPAPASDDTTISPPPTDDDTGEQATTAQPAARPAVPQPLAVPPSARVAAGSPRPQAPARPAPARPRAAAPLRSASPSATIPPRGGGRGAPPSGGDEGGSRALRIGLIVGAIVIVLAAGVFAFTQLTGGDSGDQTASTAPPTSKTNTIGSAATSSDGDSKSAQAPQSKADTTVAVLNGTTVPGLARAVADKLLAAGYKIGTVTNAPDQQRAATQVAYQQGQQVTARQVAKAIDVGNDAVSAIDEVTEATAGSDAMIVVTVGADQSP